MCLPRSLNASHCKISWLLKQELVLLYIPAEEAEKRLFTSATVWTLWRTLLIQSDYINLDKNYLS